MKTMLLAACLLPATAVNAASMDSHEVFAGLMLGDTHVEQRTESNEGSDSSLAGQLGYRYHALKHLAFDVRYLEGESTDLDNVLSLFGEEYDEVEYSAWIVSAQLSTQVLDNTWVYTNLGLASYEWELENSGERLFGDDVAAFQAEDDGTSAFWAVGAKYKWTSFSLGAEYQRLKMGDVETSNWGVQLGYAF